MNVRDFAIRLLRAWIVVGSLIFVPLAAYLVLAPAVAGWVS